MNYKTQLKAKLKNKDAVIAVIGMGYVGIPLIMRYLNVGYKAIGIDIDQSKIKAIRNGKSYIKHLNFSSLKEYFLSGKLALDYEFKLLDKADAIIICVPTPLGKHREPDLSYVRGSIAGILPFLNQGQVISLESTTYPGTTREEIIPHIHNKGLNVGKDFFVVYSPEREDPGNIDFNTSTIPKIVGGFSKDCINIGEYLYKNVISQLVLVSSLEVAEMTKLLENIHRAVNIGLVNELKIVADCMNIDMYEVVDAAATKPFGFTPYYPGPGLGGHCIPVDPFYLTWKAKELDINTKFIELAGEINRNMPKYIYSQILDYLNTENKPISKSKILIIGLSYKKNVDDLRESPAIEIMKYCQSSGAIVSYHDSFFDYVDVDEFRYKSSNLDAKILQTSDVCVLATDHDYLDKDLLIKFKNKIIDTRGFLRIRK